MQDISWKIGETLKADSTHSDKQVLPKNACLEMKRKGHGVFGISVHANVKIPILLIVISRSTFPTCKCSRANQKNAYVKFIIG